MTMHLLLFLTRAAAVLSKVTGHAGLNPSQTNRILNALANIEAVAGEVKSQLEADGDMDADDGEKLQAMRDGLESCVVKDLGKADTFQSVRKKRAMRAARAMPGGQG